ncbi:hypothetical protein Taro_026497 [Colocasia esculenta]|uniref:Uncharacterized protein n=1 Tax=Colocasia esculenta TaxID=4460 RepID=A0A843VHA8_COLES|nr:hypothetical protein [Colocasia esculenta]
MRTLRVAVAVGGIGVDANLRILQVIGSPEGSLLALTRGVAELRKETPYHGAIPVGAGGGLGVNREIVGAGLGFLQGLRPENLASTSFVAKLLSQDVNGQVVVFSWSPQLLDFLRGAAAGPFVRGCETESQQTRLTPTPQVRTRRTSHDRRPAQGRAVAVQGQYFQRCRVSTSSGVVPAV